MKLGLELGSGPYAYALAGMDDVTKKPFRWICLDKTDFSETYEHADIAFVQHDVCYELPFRDDYFDIAWTHHAMEHLPHIQPRVYTDSNYRGPQDFLIFVMNEVWRVLRPGADFHVIVPWREHSNAWRSPTHYRFFGPDLWCTFQYSHKNAIGNHEELGLHSKWAIVGNKIIDGCHSYAILKALQWESPTEARERHGRCLPPTGYQYAGRKIEGVTCV